MSKVEPTGLEIIQHLESRTYFQRRIFLRKKLAPPMHRFLYKFRAVDVDSESSIDHLRDIVVLSKLWLSSPIDFNDPFDMSARVVFEGTSQQKRERFHRVVNELGEFKSGKECEAYVDHVMTQPLHETLAQLQAGYDGATSATGIYSFAGDPRNILTWSHYAADHTGICLQFEVAQDPAALIGAVSVEYEDEFPTINWIEDTFPDAQRSMLRKYKGWRYENEKRIVQSDKAHEFLRFKPEALTSVIFGCRASKSILDKVEMLLCEREKLGHSRPNEYVASKHDTRYRLRLNRKKILASGRNGELYIEQDQNGQC